MSGPDPDARFIFNLRRESLFYQAYTNTWYYDIRSACSIQKKKYPYLEKLSLIHGGESPSSVAPCLKSTALQALCSPHHRAHFPTTRTFIYIHARFSLSGTGLFMST
jgi:hypothetical protein